MSPNHCLVSENAFPQRIFEIIYGHQQNLNSLFFCWSNLSKPAWFHLMVSCPPNVWLLTFNPIRQIIHIIYIYIYYIYIIYIYTYTLVRPSEYFFLQVNFSLPFDLQVKGILDNDSKPPEALRKPLAVRNCTKVVDRA